MRQDRIVPSARAVRATLLWGAVIGVAVLGVGGRVVMRVIAEANGTAPAFTVGGTVTVVSLGAVSGLAGALLLLVARTAAWRWPPVPTLLFHAALVLLTLRGLRPLDAQRLLLFMPLVVAFGGLLQWRTWQFRRTVRAR